MNDFDFLVGTWDSTQRRLRERLVDSDDWEVFPGHTICYRWDQAFSTDGGKTWETNGIMEFTRTGK